MMREFVVINGDLGHRWLARIDLTRYDRIWGFYRLIRELPCQQQKPPKQKV